jgi:AcrR family transcriptional regulator
LAPRHSRDTTSSLLAEPPSQGQAATWREEILPAAKRLFMEEGFERMTMRRIAAVVGTSSTALYVYFTNKGAILRAIALPACREASRRAGETLARA